jgi:hypothetical protein
VSLSPDDVHRSREYCNSGAIEVAAAAIKEEAPLQCQFRRSQPCARRQPPALLQTMAQTVSAEACATIA